MKIGIVTSWSDTLQLFEFLQKADHHYVIAYDQFIRFGEQTYEVSLERIRYWVRYLQDQWCEHIILPPVYELWIENKEKILPLFQTYLQEYCFKYSLVGKLGLVWEFADLQQAQNLISQESKKYTLQPSQLATKTFHQSFVYWVKEVPLRKHFLQILGRRNVLVNTVIKTDMKVFKDAMVDAVIPLSYSFFAFQKTLCNFFNLKKIRFHKLEKLEEIFKNSDLTTTTYSIEIHYQGHTEFLKRDKRLMWMLQRGKQIEVKWEKIIRS